MLKQIKIDYKNSIKVLNNIENIDKLVEKVLGEAIKIEKIPYNFFFLIIFISPDEMKEKNNKYRNIDEITDVLSFPTFNKEEIKEIIEYNVAKENNTTKNLSSNLRVYLEDEWSIGEIYINLERVEEQAIEYNHSIVRELAYVLTHGFYHLLGENHIDETDKKMMREKEENLLKSLGIKR